MLSAYYCCLSGGNTAQRFSALTWKQATRSNNRVMVVMGDTFLPVFDYGRSSAPAGTGAAPSCRLLGIQESDS